MDIANHICARYQLVTEPNSGQCIRELQAKGIFSQDHATMYVKMIRFRNILVHLYDEVDNERVHEILEKELDYFRMFMMDIDAVVAKQSKKTRKSTAKKK